MSGDEIRRCTAGQLRELGRAGESRTDVGWIEAMSEAEVEASVAGDDTGGARNGCRMA